MPIYEYRPVYEDKNCNYCRNGFDLIQKINDPAIYECPECGNPVRKQISMFSSQNKKNVKKIMSDENLAKHGFTKLVKDKKGSYDVVGAGREELGKKIKV